MKPSIRSRRRFLATALATAALPLVGVRLLDGARAAGLAMLPGDNPQAKALAYTDDATRAKNPNHKPGSNCANCQLYTAATGACAAFPGFRVAPTGWCMAWSKKAG